MWLYLLTECFRCDCDHSTSLSCFLGMKGIWSCVEILSRQINYKLCKMPSAETQQRGGDLLFLAFSNFLHFPPFTDVFFLEMHFSSSLRLDWNLSAAFWAWNLHSWGLNSFIGLLGLQSKLSVTQVCCTLPFTPETKNTSLYFSSRL